MRLVQSRHLHRAAALFLWLLCGIPVRALEPTQLLILVNKDQGISARVASMYQKLRGIPEGNLLRLSLGRERNLTPEAYWKLAGEPVQQYLLGHPEIRCVLTTSGVPYTVQAAAGDEGAAFDNELAAVLRENPAERKRRQPNPLFLGAGNPYGATDPRALKMVFVSRLDGPNLATITRMVEDAIAVEQTGLSGPAFGDAQGIDGIAGYGIGDFSIRSAMDQLSGAGFPVKLDLQQASWKQPPNGPGNQAEGASFYIGWYDLLNFQDIFGKQGLARGSIAWHLASQEAQDIWSENGKGWCINLMRRGAAVTLGPVREPYISAFPHGDIFVSALLAGGSVAEGYWLSLPEVSWAMVLLGDPLYRPFAHVARPSLVAQAYVADNPSGVLQKGQTGSLLVQIECVGPAGSSTGPMIARTELDMGLAAASGPVTIPPLHAGQSIVVRIPSVTAGTDETGMFRLHLAVQDEREGARKIVLEGRTGFARVTGGLSPKLQMDVSPGGETVISGLPGRSFLVPTASLRSIAISPPQGLVLSSAVFSPDSKYVAMALYEPQQKKATIVIAEIGKGTIHPLPAGSLFLRWLDADHVLIKMADHLVSHSISGAPDRTFEASLGISGNVLAGTDTVMLTTADGKFGFQENGKPFQQVLDGIHLASAAAAISNDLTMFGALDTEKKLWVQHGLQQKPELVAEHVERADWGPISHRVLVEGQDHKSRVYDGRDRSWVDLGTVLLAAWSPDEQRLLYVESAGTSESYLTLLSGKQVRRLCPMTRIGSVAKIAITGKGDRAFLLASLAGQLNVWMTALPPE